jgi:hypothetical protein
MKKNTFLSILGAILLVVLGAILPFCIQSWQDKTKVLEYTVFKITVKKPFLNNNKVNMYLDSIKIDSLSILRFEIYNNTGKCFNDLELYFELEPVNFGKIKIVDEKYYGQGNSDEFIEQLKKEPSKLNENAIKLGYRIKVANKNGYYNPVFVVEYTFINDYLPNISKPTFVNTGIDLKELNKDKYYRINHFKNFLFMFLTIIATTSYLIFITGKLKHRNEEYRKLSLIRHITKQFKQSKTEEFNKLNNPAKLVSFLEFKKDEYLYNSSPKWLNWFSGINQPKLYDIDEIKDFFDESIKKNP